MEKISATVEGDGGDTLCEGALGNSLAYDSGCLDSVLALALSRDFFCAPGDSAAAKAPEARNPSRLRPQSEIVIVF